MEVINQILSTYALFFDWAHWVEVLSDPVNWGLIFSLVLIEGLQGRFKHLTAEQKADLQKVTTEKYNKFVEKANA